MAPWRRATSAVSSVLLLSTTIGRYPSGIAASTPGSDADSLRQGSTTVTGQSGIPVDARSQTTAAEAARHDESVTSALVDGLVTGPAGLVSQIMTRVLIADDDTVVR